MNPLRLEQMTVFDVEPWEVIDIAEATDLPLISFFVADAMPGARFVTPADLPRLRERLRDSPVRVDTVEVFALQANASAAEAQVALAAELGARAIVSLHVIPGDESEAAERLAALAALAARYGLGVSLEPISMGLVRTPAEGARVVQQSGAANAGLTLDLLHIVRTGTPIETLAALDPVMITSAQLCDGPATIDPAFLIEEAGYERGLPGSGAFPVIEFLRALPATVPLGIEVPMKSLRERGVSALERTRRAVDATRRVQQAADRMT